MKPSNFYSGPPPQGPVGRKPLGYLNLLPFSLSAHSPGIPHHGLEKLSRADVRAIAGNSSIPPLVAYACIMAWGGQRMDHYRSTLRFDREIACMVDCLRGSTRTREIDFHFAQSRAKPIKGLGISFYTKLLFFLRPDPNAYILDQWTAKSAHLLFPKIGISLTGVGLPDPRTTSQVYGEYCKSLESCCGPHGWGPNWKTGEDVEVSFFDKPHGPWRLWVKKQY